MRRLTLEIRCPLCGSMVAVEPRGVWLTLTSASAGSYEFRCPSCEVDVTKPADRTVIARLRSAGIRPVNDVNLTSGRGGPVLTEDDLIEFGRKLEGGDPWLELGRRSSLPG